MKRFSFCCYFLGTVWLLMGFFTTAYAYEPSECIADDYSTASAPAGHPVVWDVDGDGKDEIGIFSNTHGWVIDFNHDGILDPETETYSRFGTDVPGAYPVYGYLDYNNTFDIGIFHQGSWVIDINNNHINDPADLVVQYGTIDSLPIFGKFNGGLTYVVGYYSNGLVYLDVDRSWSTKNDHIFQYGRAGDRPVFGDWIGSGKTQIGFYRAGGWYLDTNPDYLYNDTNGDTFVARYGGSSSVPVVGDWDGDGLDEIGIREGLRFVLDTNKDKKVNLGLCDPEDSATFGETGFCIEDTNNDTLFSVEEIKDCDGGICPFGMTACENLAGGEPTCPDGGILDTENDVCFIEVHIECDPNYVYDSTLDTCVAAPQCDPEEENTYFNIFTDRCEKLLTLEGCPEGYVIDESEPIKCIRPVVCSRGEYNPDYDRCESAPLVTCPPGGYTLLSGKCTMIPPCPGSMVYSSERDRCEGNPLTSCPDGETYDSVTGGCMSVVSCELPATFNPDTGRCELPDHASCPEGWTADPVTGMCERPVYCTFDGFYDAGRGLCVLPPNHDPCPEGYEYDAAQDLCIGDPWCPEGSDFSLDRMRCEMVPNLACDFPYVLNPATGNCVLDANLVCLEGTTYDPVSKMCGTEPSQCPPGYSWNDVFETCTTNYFCGFQSELNPVTGMCELQGTISCDPGYLITDDQTMCTQPVSCSDGGSFDGILDLCTRESIGGICTNSEEYTYNNTVKQCISQPDCSTPGALYDPETKQCEIPASLSCDAPYHLLATYNSADINCVVSLQEICTPYNAIYEDGNCVTGLRECGSGYLFNSAADACTANASCPTTTVCDYSGACSSITSLNPTTDKCEGSVVWGCDQGLISDSVNNVCYQNITCPSGGTYDPVNDRCLDAAVSVICPDGYAADGASCSRPLDCSLFSVAYPGYGDISDYYSATYNPTTGKCEQTNINYRCGDIISYYSESNILASAIIPDPITHKCIQDDFTYPCDYGGGTYDPVLNKCVTNSNYGCYDGYTVGGSGLCENPSICATYYNATRTSTTTCEYDSILSPKIVPDTACSAQLDGFPSAIFISLHPNSANTLIYAKNSTGDFYITFDASCNITFLGRKNPGGSLGDPFTNSCSLSVAPGASVSNNCYLQVDGATIGGMVRNTSFTSPGYACFEWIYPFGNSTSSVYNYFPPPFTSPTGTVMPNGGCVRHQVTTPICPDTYTWLPPFTAGTTNPTLSADMSVCTIPEGYRCPSSYQVNPSNPSQCIMTASCLMPGVFDPATDTCSWDAKYSCPTGFFQTVTKENMTCTWLPSCGPVASSSGSDCISPATAVCDTGYTWDASLGKCVMGASQYCQSTYDATFNSTTNRCESPQLPLCPTGSTFNGTQCVSTPSCPTGGSFDSTLNLCSEGSDSLCETGWTFVGEDDSCQMPVACPGTGATLNLEAQACVMPPVGSCGFGTTYDPVEKVCRGPVECAEGGSLDTALNLCVSPIETPLCPGEYVWNDAADRCTLPPNPCPAPSVLNTQMDVCEIPSELQCPLEGDFTLNGSVCEATPMCAAPGTFNLSIFLCDAGDDGSCLPDWTLNTTTSTCQSPVECPYLGEFSADADACIKEPELACDYCGAETASCPVGYSLSPVSSLCERDAIGLCPESSLFNPDTDRCEQNLIPCPPGSVWSPDARGCLSDPACPSGGVFVPERGRCESPPEMICGIATFTVDPNDSEQCISPIVCPYGGVYNKTLEKCVVAPIGGTCDNSAYAYSVSNRVCQDNPECTHPSSVFNGIRDRCEYSLPPKCAYGYTFDGEDECTIAASSLCSYGGSYQPGEGTCLKTPAPCPAGYTYDTHLDFCIADHVCPPGTSLIDGKCQTPVAFQCPAGSSAEGTEGCVANPDCAPGLLDEANDLCVDSSSSGECPADYIPEGTDLCWKSPLCPEGTSFMEATDRCETPPGAAPSCSDPEYAFNPATMVCEDQPACSIGTFSEEASACVGTLGPGACEVGWTEYAPTPSMCEIPILCLDGWSFNTTDKLCHKDTPSSIYPATSNAVPDNCPIRFNMDAAVNIPKGGSGTIGSDISQLPKVYSIKAYTDNYCNVTRVERVTVDLQVALAWDQIISPGSSSTLTNETAAVSYKIENLTVINPSSYSCPSGGVLVGATCEIYPAPVANSCSTVGATAVLSSAICIKDKTPSCPESGMTYDQDLGLCIMPPDCGDAGFNPDTDKCVIFATPGTGCPAGTDVNTGGVCTTSPDCNGYPYNPITHRCETEYGLGCDNGFTFNTALGVCTKEPGLTCPTGTVYQPESDLCYAPVTEICPVLTANTDGMCIGTPYCPGGYPFNDSLGKCDASSVDLCPYFGYHLDAGLDSCLKTIVCPESGELSLELNQCILPAINLLATCDFGTTEDEILNVCYSGAYCVDNNDLNTTTNYCTSIPISYLCPGDYQYDEDISDCVAPPPLCPSGTTFNAALGQCEQDKSPSCPQGSFVDSVNKVCWEPLSCTGTFDPSTNKCNSGLSSICPPDWKFTYTDDGYICTLPVPCPNEGMLNRNIDRCQVGPDQECEFPFTLDRATDMCYLGSPCLDDGVLNIDGKCELPETPICPGEYYLSTDQMECLSVPGCEPPAVKNPASLMCEMPPSSDKCPYPYVFDPVRAACTSTPDCHGRGTYNPATNQCESEMENNCIDPSYTFNEETGRCERTPVCRDGAYHAEYDQCVKVVNLTCPDGYVYIEERDRCEKTLECEGGLPYMANLDACVVDQACYGQGFYDEDIDQCLIDTISVGTKVAEPEYCGDLPKAFRCHVSPSTGYLDCFINAGSLIENGPYDNFLGSVTIELVQVSALQFLATWKYQYQHYNLSLKASYGSGTGFPLNSPLDLYYRGNCASTGYCMGVRHINSFVDRWKALDPNWYFGGNIYCGGFETETGYVDIAEWSLEEYYGTPNQCILPKNNFKSDYVAFVGFPLEPATYMSPTNPLRFDINDGENTHPFIDIPGPLYTTAPYSAQQIKTYYSLPTLTYGWGEKYYIVPVVYNERYYYHEREPHTVYYTNDTNSNGQMCYWDYDKYYAETVKGYGDTAIPACESIYTSFDINQYLLTQGLPDVSQWPKQSVGSFTSQRPHYPTVKYSKLISIGEVFSESYTGNNACPMSWKIDLINGTFTDPQNDCGGGYGGEYAIENLKLCHECGATADNKIEEVDGKFSFSVNWSNLFLPQDPPIVFPEVTPVTGEVVAMTDGGFQLTYTLQSAYETKTKTVLVSAVSVYEDRIVDPNGDNLGDVRIRFDAPNRTLYFGNFTGWQVYYLYLANNEFPSACLTDESNIVFGSTPFCEPGQWRVGNLCLEPAVCESGRFDYATDTCVTDVVKECKFGAYDEIIGACVAPPECPNGTLDRRADVCYQEYATGCGDDQTEIDGICSSGAGCLNDGTFLPATDECLLYVDFECDPPLIFYPEEGICAEPVECPDDATMDPERGVCVTTSSPVCSEAGSELDTELDKCFISPDCGPNGLFDASLDLCTADVQPNCDDWSYDSAANLCYGPKVCTTTGAATYNEATNSCELKRDTTCGLMFMEDGTNVCFQDAICPRDEAFAEPSISPIINKCVSPPQHTCPTGYTYSGMPESRCEGIIICPGGGSYDPHTNLCSAGEETVAQCPLGPEFPCLPTSASKQLFASCDDGYVYNSEVNVCEKPTIFVSGEVKLADYYMFYIEGTTPYRVYTNLNLGETMGDGSYIDFDMTENFVKISGRIWQDGYWSMEGNQNQLIVKNAGGAIVGTLSFQADASKVTISGPPISIRGLLDMRPNQSKIDFYNPGGGIVASLDFARNTHKIPPNTVSETFCSPYPCHLNEYELEPDFADYHNDGEIDPNTQECLGEIKIFNGHARKCLHPGMRTNWFDCCEPTDGGTFIFERHCNEESAEVAEAIEDKRVVEIGEFCVSEIPVLGCVQNSTVVCVFDSMLARIIQEQGRLQLKHFIPTGRWGEPRRPNCEGFSPEDFAALDFGRIDLSEYINSIVTDIDMQTVQEEFMERVEEFHESH